MPTAREEISKKIGEIVSSPDFTDGEKFVVRAQCSAVGSFESKLWDLLCIADNDNVKLLAHAFPAHVQGLRSWRHGGLGGRLRAAGLDI